MVRVVTELAVDGLRDGMLLAADGHGAGEVGIGQRLEGAEQYAPALLPQPHEFGARLRRIDKLAIAIAGDAFAVGVGEPGPAGAHVPGHMLDDDRDGVGLGIDGRQQLLVGDLRDRALRQTLVGAKTLQRIARQDAVNCKAILSLCRWRNRRAGSACILALAATEWP